jgi:2-polyprenyl-6-methoxyphenol hydroxylase-like FAD-dependent oxidoreductase
MRVAIIGGGVGGLVTAMLLGQDGHDVTLLERDAASPPDPADAWADWERRGVNQFRLLHFFAPGFRRRLEAELPHAAAALDAAGALRFNPMRLAPEQLTGGFRDGDEEFEAVTARRPVAEAALAGATEATPGVTVRRGVSVAGLVADGSSPGGVPHAEGVRFDDGTELRADLVVDASGRRSQLCSWLTAIGAPAPIEEVEDSGFIYYGRHFRSGDGSVPAMLGGLLTAAGSVSLLTLPADNGTWGLGIIVSAGDAALRGLKDTARWTEVARSFPTVAHWTDGEPLDDGVVVMAKIEDRYRRFVVGGRPVATGVVAVGDSWACTNPSLGRGATLALLHAVALRDTLRSADGDPAALALRFDDATEAIVGPWYRTTVAFDRHRLRDMEAAIAGEPYDPGDPEWEIGQAMQAAAGADPDVFRSFLRIVGVLSLPEEVLAQPGILERVIELGSGWRDATPLGPDRAALLEMVGR